MEIRQAALSFIAVGLAACSNPSSDWFPMAEKMQWEYAIEYASRPDKIQTGISTIRIEGSETIDGKKYIKTSRVLTGFPGVEPRINYYRKSSDGLYEIRDSHRDAGEYLLIPFPVEVGNSWHVQAAGLDLMYKAEAIVSVPLPERTYKNCLQLTFKGTADGDQLEGETYQAPGIGTIRQVERYNSGTLEVRLKSFGFG
jgi:hypothetical protein